MNAEDYIGQVVLVQIDRPLGSKHPEHGFIYSVNYGYLPGVKMPEGDGEELGAYVLGVFEPIQQFEGKCIAIIRRLNDNDDKLVIVPVDKHYSDLQIQALTEFQERFFESTILR